MTRKMSSILETRFRLLEEEKFITEMLTDIDYFKEQIFLISEAIKENCKVKRFFKYIYQYAHNASSGNKSI